ncbi:2-phospho-L-lactate guanylyltransferase [Marmoricola endophyticus]|uniref:2-phospho-L-lactate guanylyltransferase n=1 Tax=Marmoricola endophyticus TaxID=2040280 RepID=UPI001E3F9F6F|nr:2-phospho-L-lactate guanylyltransferase [Marmoricola endophyticus]
MSDPGIGYALLVPVKDPGLAKTRLAAEGRPALVRAFALDAMAAARESALVRRVHLVGDDEELTSAARLLGVTPLPDEGEGDLNRALHRAAAAVGEGGPVAAMLGDLPCLIPSDLDRALSAALGAGEAFVPDAEGTGTTLVACAGPFRSAFGPGSRAAHAALGLAEVGIQAPTLRRDVDTLADLDAARALGLGPRTRAALEA